MKKLKRMIASLLTASMLMSMSVMAVRADGDETDVPETPETVEVAEGETPGPETVEVTEEETPEPEAVPAEEETVEPAAEPADQDVEPVDPAVEPDQTDDQNEEPSAAPAEGSEEAVPEVETAYPAVTLSKTLDGVTVTLRAPEGSLPEGVQLSVTRVNDPAVFAAVEQTLEAEGKELTDAVAFDVTPLDKDGKPVQPLLPVAVFFSGTGLNIDENGDVAVFRVSDDASSVVEMDTAVADSEKQLFSTDHFTIYVAGGSTSDPNGDGSGPNSSSNPYVMEYGETVTLMSNETTGTIFANYWEVQSGGNYISFNAGTQVVTNQNQSDSEQTVVIRHHYRVNWSLNPYRTEDFYIKVKPEVLKVDFMVQFPGEAYTSVHTSSVYFNNKVEDIPELDETIEEGGKTYTLYSWYLDEECETPINLEEVAITKDTTVYARYTTPDTIHYVKNTSDAATVPDDQEGGVGNTVVLGGASRSGYALDSWNTEADGSGESYSEGDSVTMPEGGMVLYAQWTADKMVMRYHYNYLFSPTDVFRSVSNIPTNSQTTLLSDIPTRTGGYIFLGWAESPNDDPAYFPGATYQTGDGGDDGIIHLYAQWGELSDYGPLTAKGTEIPYDGQEHKIEGVEEGESEERPGFVYLGTEDFALFTVDFYADISNITASGTNAGSYATPIAAEVYGTYPWWLGGFRSADEYVQIDNNILKITQVELTIDTDSDEKHYDGTALTAGGTVSFGDQTAEFTNDGTAVTLVNGETLNIRTTGSQTEVGESDNDFELDWGKPEWGSEASTALKYNYKITVGEVGTLTVLEEEVPAVITYSLNGGTYNGSTADIVENHVVGEEITIHEAPTREGFKFVEWEGSSYQPGDSYTVAGDHTFTAKWEEIKPTPEPEKKDAVPDTSDRNSTPLWTALLMMSMLSAGGAFFLRRKRWN